MTDDNRTLAASLSLSEAQIKALEEFNGYDEKQMRYAINEAARRSVIHAIYKKQGKA